MIDDRIQSLRTRLQTASTTLNVPADELVSIKIRPTNRVPAISDGWIPDRYVYSKEYRDIQTAMARQFPFVSVVRLFDGPAHLMQSPDGRLLLVEHETGPEVIACLALATSVVSFGAALTNLIATVVKVIHDRNQQRSTKPDEALDPVSGRYYIASGISVEVRTESSERRCLALPLPLPGDSSGLETGIRDAIFGASAWSDQ